MGLANQSSRQRSKPFHPVREELRGALARIGLQLNGEASATISACAVIGCWRTTTQFPSTFAVRS